MNCEEATPFVLGGDRNQVLVLEAGPGEAADRPRRKAERNGRTRRRFGRCFHVIAPPSATVVLRRLTVSDRLERAVLAIRQVDVGAGAAPDELPCVALEVGGRGPLARRARTGRAIVLTFQGDAEAFLFVGGDGRVPLSLRQRGGGGHGRERGRESAGKNERTANILPRHWISPVQGCIACWANTHRLIRPARGLRYGEPLTNP